jgi:hypothetical protein
VHPRRRDGIGGRLWHRRRSHLSRQKAATAELEGLADQPTDDVRDGEGIALEARAMKLAARSATSTSRGSHRCSTSTS